MYTIPGPGVTSCYALAGGSAACPAWIGGWRGGRGPVECNRVSHSSETRPERRKKEDKVYYYNILRLTQLSEKFGKCQLFLGREVLLCTGS